MEADGGEAEEDSDDEEESESGDDVEEIKEGDFRLVLCCHIMICCGSFTCCPLQNLEPHNLSKIT